MLRCESCQERLLDLTFGLLDATEADVVAAHAASCEVCSTSKLEIERFHGLVNQAARGSFPEVKFVVPATELVEPSRKETAVAPEVTVTSVWIRWVVAASLLLTAAGLGGPTARDLAGYFWTKPEVDRQYAAVDRAKADRNATAEKVTRARVESESRLEASRAKHEEILNNWIGAEQKVSQKLAAQPFTLEVSGPTAAIPGAPNDYRVKAVEKTGKLRPVTVEARVKDANGSFDRKVEPTTRDGETVVQLAPAFWADVKPGSDLFLFVSAKDPRSGETVELSEPIRLLDPIFTTYLTTDKPMYRSGETVYFRSLTLDRTRLLPPDRDVNLRFDLFGPSGQPVPNMSVVGLSKPSNKTGLILGPDGKPVRGVGVGAFALPANLVGGEYTLNVTELPLNATSPRPGSLPLATRRFIVNAYTPDRLDKTLEFDAKTYGPGDAVTVKLTVLDQARPKAGADTWPQLDYKTGPDSPLQTLLPGTGVYKTDAAGVATATFFLPKNQDLRDAVVSVKVTANGLTETLVRRVPLATRKLNVEFFPEGGDLVAGVENRVYFRATTTLGKPADVAGWITDGTRDICEVRTLTDADQPGVNQGLGAFALTPQKGKKYALRLNTPLGTLQPASGLTATPTSAVVGAAIIAAKPGYALPVAKAEGVVMRVLEGVTTPGEPINVELTSVGGEPRNVLVGAYTRGRAVAHAKAKLEPGKPTRVALDPGAIKLGGVTRITVFEEPAANGPGREILKPITERLVFRQSGESLKLSAVAGSSGAFRPGSPVEMTITATDEAGQPKPAVVWAAVVNKSVVAMADEKTARSLPTQLLLGGEVRNSDDLEHADFLLTNHPKAATSLDLLLGTQGWRRFAEQAPDQFRDRVSAGEAEQFFTAIGQRSAMPAGIRSSAQNLFEEYWPKYEAAVLELEAAENDQRTGESLAGVQKELAQADAEHNGRLISFGAAIDEFETFDKEMAQRRHWLPFTLLFTWGLAGLMIAVRQFRPAGARERRTLGRGAIGFFVLGCFILAVTLLTQSGDESWRSIAGSAPRPNKDRYYGRVPTPAPMPAPKADVGMGGPGAAMMRQGSPVPGGGNMVLHGNTKDAVRPAMPVPTDATGDRKTPPRSFNTPRGASSPANKALTRLQRSISERNGRDGNDGGANVLKSLAVAAPKAAPLVVREYAHQRAESADATRRDFTETLLWQPVLVLPQDGKATVKFDLSDSVTGYQVLVAGHTLDGRLGSSASTIEVRKAFAADPKLPIEVSSTDKIDLPVMLTNGTDQAMKAKVKLTASGVKVESDKEPADREMPANRTSRATIRFSPTITEGTVPVTVVATAPGHEDRIERTLRVVPDGFPAQGATADALESTATARINLPKSRVPGTLKVTVTVYPNTLSEIQGGLDGLLKEPSGCFEQSSTANYPNVLATEYMKETGTIHPQVAQRAQEFMTRGHAKLVGFECPKGQTGSRVGYEWFGAKDRPHEALTAYGLLQFTDMARVYPVDADMLKRTKQFLLDSRDGKGGFRRSTHSVDTFGKAPEPVTNAYIVWAITESEKGSREPSDLSKELNALLDQTKQGPTSTDPYFLALVANALLNRGQSSEGVAILKTLAAKQAAYGRISGAATSITRSSGKALDIETTAFAVLGWFKANRAQEFTLNIASAMKWIGSQRDGNGSFGSTQSTILALKALIEHARSGKRLAESGTIRVRHGTTELLKRDFTNTAYGPVVLEIAEPEKVFTTDAHDLVVETTAKQTYPVTVAWACRTRQPNSSPECAVKLETKLERTELLEGDSVRLNVRVVNGVNRDHGMVMAIVGIPAGLKLPEDMKQLNDLTARPNDGTEPQLSYWETQGRELTLYWRAMAPNQTIDLGLQLIAEVPGVYRGPASRAYLYYGAEHKHWVEPLAVAIR